MNPWIALVAGLVVGAVTAYLLSRTTYAVRAASVATERDLLRERVLDLEASLAEDLETASLLAPLRDALGRVERQVGVLERDRVEQFGALRAVMGRVESEAQQLGRQTQSLAGSLRSSSVRGSWGEVQLRRVLEASGMLARCDFEEQVRARSRHDREVRPDVVVRLPGDRSLVIDAKAPMAAFLDAQTEELDDDERAELLRNHAGALRQHVQALSAKDYWSAFDSTPEMVVCFVPSDAMLGAALDADPGLHERAMAARVVLVGPGTLLALLRTVAFGWQQDALSSSARELLALGQELYRRLSTLGTHAAKMGRSLHATVESYNQFVGALESRVFVTARRMQELDLVSDDLPQLAPVETGPRVLTAIELLEAVTSEDRRPEVDLVDGRGTPGTQESVDESA
jgi:DNA recombination protein RmuC